MGIIEMRPPHKFDGMVSTLPHAAHLGDTHGNKNVRFNPFGKFSNTPCGEHAFVMGVIFLQHLEPVIRHQVVRYEIQGHSAGIDICNLMPAGNDSDRYSFLRKVIRQPGGHEGIDCQRGSSDLLNLFFAGDKKMITAAVVHNIYHKWPAAVGQTHSNR